MLFLFKNNEGKTMTNTIIYNEHYTDDDVRWIMQQVHDKEIIISNQIEMIKQLKELLDKKQ